MGKETAPIIEKGSLSEAIVRAAVDIRTQFGRIDQAARTSLARLFGSTLVSRKRPGRKTSEAVRTADRMQKQGKPWKQIYPAVIADFQTLPLYERQDRQRKLRRAVAANRQRRRKHSSNRHTPQTDS